MEDKEQEIIDILQSFVDIAESYIHSGKYKDLEEDVKATKWALNKIDTLTKERDYYKARYLETNESIIEAGKILGRDK